MVTGFGLLQPPGTWGQCRGQGCRPSALWEAGVWMKPAQGATPWEGTIPWWKEDRTPSSL